MHLLQYKVTQELLYIPNDGSPVNWLCVWFMVGCSATESRGEPIQSSTCNWHSEYLPEKAQFKWIHFKSALESVRNWNHKGNISNMNFSDFPAWYRYRWVPRLTFAFGVTFTHIRISDQHLDYIKVYWMLLCMYVFLSVCLCVCLYNISACVTWKHEKNKMRLLIRPIYEVNIESVLS